MKTDINDCADIINMLLIPHQDLRLITRQEYLIAMLFLEEHFPDKAENLKCREDVKNDPEKYAKAQELLKSKGLL